MPVQRFKVPGIVNWSFDSESFVMIVLSGAVGPTTGRILAPTAGLLRISRDCRGWCIWAYWSKGLFLEDLQNKKNKMSMYFKVAVHRDKVIDVNNRLNVAQAKVLAFFHNQRIDIFIKFYLGSKNSWDSQCDSSIFQVNDQSFLFSVLFWSMISIVPNTLLQRRWIQLSIVCTKG